jgi:hypothetical protein
MFLCFTSMNMLWQMGLSFASSGISFICNEQ